MNLSTREEFFCSGCFMWRPGKPASQNPTGKSKRCTPCHAKALRLAAESPERRAKRYAGNKKYFRIPYHANVGSRIIEGTGQEQAAPPEPTKKGKARDTQHFQAQAEGTGNRKLSDDEVHALRRAGSAGMKARDVRPRFPDIEPHYLAKVMAGETHQYLPFEQLDS